MMSCTLSLRLSSAEANTPPLPSGATTIDASTPETFSSSSAACAATTRSSVLGRGDRYLAVELRALSILYFATVSSMSDWNRRLTAAVSVAAQHRRRVKGALAGADGEALGIEHDAGHQRLGLAAEHICRFWKLLDYLGHKLTRRRCIGSIKPSAASCI